jgi:hypothetical protein
MCYLLDRWGNPVIDPRNRVSEVDIMGIYPKPVYHLFADSSNKAKLEEIRQAL